MLHESKEFVQILQSKGMEQISKRNAICIEVIIPITFSLFYMTVSKDLFIRTLIYKYISFLLTSCRLNDYGSPANRFLVSEYLVQLRAFVFYVCICNGIMLQIPHVKT